MSMIPRTAAYRKNFNLIHRAKRDGGTPADFHRCCDNKGPTLVLVRSSAGRTCGGYTSVPWTSKRGKNKDKDSVLFAVDS